MSLKKLKNKQMKIINQASAGGIVFKNLSPTSYNLKPIHWLICQHSQHKGWVFPKGLIGDKINNEPMEQAALRETKEETGVEAKIVNKQPIKTFYQFQFQGNLIKKTVFYFLMEYISGDTKNHDWEMQDVKFVSEKEVKKTLTYSSDKEAFEKILKLV